MKKERGKEKWRREGEKKGRREEVAGEEGKWPRIYALVAASAVVTIVLLYFFSAYFAS